MKSNNGKKENVEQAKYRTTPIIKIQSKPMSRIVISALPEMRIPTKYFNELDR